MKRTLFAFAAVMIIAAPVSLISQERGATGSAGVAAPVARTNLRVLWIAAHPDDEDTQFITWLSRGGRAETAYLSLTRGDGGQNLIGNELGEQLGIIRTEELLAARRIDGAHQYFTRAYDFGFSKTPQETYKHWPKDSVLADVVTIVRAFRPHIIITTFSGTPRDGHGHHQVSAILAKEAYDSAAADTVRFPVAKYGPPWTPLKFYRSAFFSPSGTADTLRVNVGEYNPALGKSYSEIAAESRSQHKSQGFGTLQRKGVVWDRVRREATRVNAGTPASQEHSIFDGLDSLARMGKPQPDPRLAEPNVAVEAVADRRILALGDSAKVAVTVYNRSAISITVHPTWPGAAGAPAASVLPDSSYRWDTFVKGTEITQPWWLATPRNGDLFSPPVSKISEDEREKQNWLGLNVCASSGATNCVAHRTPVVYHFADPVRGDVQRPLAVAPPISVTLDRSVELARAGVPLDRFFSVTIRSALMSRKPVTVSLSLPSGLTADSAQRTVLVDSTATRSITFRVRGRLPAGTHVVGATATVDGVTTHTGYVPIDYEHITPERQYRDAAVTIKAVDVALPKNLNVAYVPGVGDNVEPMLEEMGVPVTVVDPEQIPMVDLSKFTTVVVGPRAYQASQILRDNNTYLLEYVKNGGRLVVQYGQYELTRPGMMPYPITIRNPHDRVTDETAPVTILDPTAAVLNFPNRITQQDFAGWVQERALYMPYAMDAHYHAVISMNDPGEPPNKGAIISAKYGKGTYFYVPLALFRQLPAGVSGGARIFANLLAGK